MCKIVLDIVKYSTSPNSKNKMLITIIKYFTEWEKEDSIVKYNIIKKMELKKPITNPRQPAQYVFLEVFSICDLKFSQLG